MFIELHLLQNFAPSNLNRDDTNAPKDCEFGGHRRARISSQCIKRSIRRRFEKDLLLPPENLAHRTTRLIDELADRLEKSGKDRQQAHDLASFAVKGIGLGVKDNGKTEFLLFLGEQEIQKTVALLNDNWDSLTQATRASSASEKPVEPAGETKKKTNKEKKQDAKKAIPAELKKKLEHALDGGRAADLALFGRMLADLPGKNIDGACQVAHALSSNKVSMEMDFFTAVDDLKKPGDTSGADMLGSVEFNSSCFYRYANIDVDQLRENLQGDSDLANKTIEAFLRASVSAIPTGKQNSMAAQNPPSLVLVVTRDRGLWSLANAFVQPVRPASGKSLVQNSMETLDRYWGKLLDVYGGKSIRSSSLCQVDEADIDCLKKSIVPNLETLIATVMKEVIQ